MDLCWELRNAVFFWGHDAISVVEQVKFIAMEGTSSVDSSVVDPE
jgi:hypothetical protein